MPEDRIEVVVHPESIVHSAVVFRDGAVLALAGGYSLLKAVSSGDVGAAQLPAYALGTAVSYLASLVAIRFLLKFRLPFLCRLFPVIILASLKTAAGLALHLRIKL